MSLREPLRTRRVVDATYRERVSIEKGATVADAVAAMQRERVGALLVLDGTRLAGIFTERDLLKRVLGAGRPLSTPLAEAMTADPASTTVDEPLHRVLGRMHSGGHRHLPVLDGNGAPIGTISIKRAVHYLADHMPKAVYNLPPEPGRFPARAEGG